MPAAQGSPFAGLPLLEAVVTGGERRHVLGLRLRPVDAPGPTRHVVQQGEGLDLIARTHLGDEGLWWRVLDANPLRYPLDLAPGEVLRLPAPGRVTRANRARSF
jgi:nucleoid-associated protein YgaU